MPKRAHTSESDMLSLSGAKRQSRFFVKLKWEVVLLKKYEKYMKWIIAFVFGAALIAVYKTFDNFQHVLSFIGDVFSILTPFIIGFFIAYILNLPCKKLENLYSGAKFAIVRTRSRGLSIFTVYILFVFILSIAIRTVIPSLYSNIIDLYNNIIPFTQNALSEIENFQEKLGLTFFEINEDTAKETVQKLLNSINIKEFGKYAKGAINFTSGLFKTFIALIVSIYMLTDREHLYEGYKRIVSVLLPEGKAETLQRYMKRVNSIFSNYIYCCVLDAVIVAILATIILSLIGVKYSIIFGTLIGLCNLIPYFGAIISNCITVIVTIFTGGWIKALWSAIALFVLGQLDGNFIGPKIMGNKLDVRPLWIIFAVTLGGGLFGVGGMLLSVPVMMVVKMVVSEWISNIEEKRAAEKSNQE